MGGESTDAYGPAQRRHSTGPVARPDRTARCPDWPSHWACVLFLGGFGWGRCLPALHRAHRLDDADDRRGDRVLARAGRRRRDTPRRRRRLQGHAPGATRRWSSASSRVGGDTVSCCTDGRLTVNGKQIDEPYLPEGSGRPSSPITSRGDVPKGRCSSSATSAAAPWTPPPTSPTPPSGTVPRGAVDARVDAVVWPMERHAGAPHRLRAARRRSPRPARCGTITRRWWSPARCSSWAAAPTARRQATGAAASGGRSGAAVPAEARGRRPARTRTRAGCARWPGSCCSTRATASCCCTATSRTIRPTTGGSPPAAAWRATETREEAALRELAEETGITEVELGPVLWRRMCSFPFAGRRWDQDEWYYLARTDRDGHRGRRP